jgi:hypothetical protein
MFFLQEAKLFWNYFKMKVSAGNRVFCVCLQVKSSALPFLDGQSPDCQLCNPQQ